VNEKRLTRIYLRKNRWKVSLKKIEKFVQFKIDHPEIEKTQIQTGAIVDTTWFLLERKWHW
jgi:hypothetical protein